MEFHSCTFFQEDQDEYPRVAIAAPVFGRRWEFTVHIEDKYKSRISLHLLTESDLYKFCNSVISELRRYRKEQGYDS